MKYPRLIQKILLFLSREFEDRETKRQRLFLELEEAQRIPDLWERFDAVVKVSNAQSNAWLDSDAQKSEVIAREVLSLILRH